MRPKLSIATLLLLSGCKLLASGVIDETCEDLPGGCDGTVDTDDTRDTEDTAPPYVPDNPFVLGLAVASETESEVSLRAFDTDFELLIEAVLPLQEDTSVGPVAYDHDQGALYGFDNGSRKLVTYSESAGLVLVDISPEITDFDDDIVDMMVADGTLYLVGGSTLLKHEVGDGFVTEIEISNAAPQLVRSIFAPSSSSSVFLLDIGEAGQEPDLYRVDLDTQRGVRSYENFDDGQGRAQAGFYGLENLPYVCSELGAVYSVESLDAGDRVPLAMPLADEMIEHYGVDMALDVSDCSYDPIAERYLVFSRALGAINMDEYGHVLPHLAPDDGESFVRGYFFVVPADSDTE